jgi:hypothetical protein
MMKSFGKEKVGRSGENVVAAGLPCKVQYSSVTNFGWQVGSHTSSQADHDSQDQPPLTSTLAVCFLSSPLFDATTMAQLLLLQET